MFSEFRRKIKFCLVRGCHVKMTIDAKSSFDWSGALIDAFIMAMVGFFSTLASLAVAGIPGMQGMVASSISGMFQFFSFLAIKRGIVVREGKEERKDGSNEHSV
jgi:hypothetical protein